MSTKETGIYAIRNITNNKLYIGSASSNRGFLNRWNSHLCELKQNKHHSQKLQRAWNKYGEENFKFEVLEKCAPENAVALEQVYIDKYQSYTDAGYNISPTAGNNLGFRHSEETKKKISQIQQGKNNNRYGIKHNKQTIEKMSRAQRGENNHMYGKHRDSYIKNKISNALRGVKKSPETIQKMSNAKKGNKNPAFGKKQTKEIIEKRIKKLKKPIRRSDGKIYPSIKDAAENMNIKYQSISAALRKGYRSGNYYWTYIDEY